MSADSERIEQLRGKIAKLEVLASDPGTTGAESRNAQEKANALRAELAELQRRPSRRTGPSADPQRAAPVNAVGRKLGWAIVVLCVWLGARLPRRLERWNAGLDHDDLLWLLPPAILCVAVLLAPRTRKAAAIDAGATSAARPGKASSPWLLLVWLLLTVIALAIARTMY